VQLVPRRVEAVVGGPGRDERAAYAASYDRTAGVGPLHVDAEVGDDGAITWSVANRGDRPASVRSVALVLDLEDAPGPLRMFRHGYQSWSHSGVAVFGIDRDPSHAPGSLRMARGVHHADADVARPHELRSEWCTLLQTAGDAPTLVGFDGGDRHDGTLRLREREDSGAELWVEAFFGGAVLAPGERRELHGVQIEGGDGRSASELLEGWADRAGAVGRARTATPFQVGWCSWYHYFHDVTEADLRANLALAGDWPFDVFQLDDGYQAAIGDWLSTNERFPSRIEDLAGAIAAEGRTPGLWLAPFITAPDSEVATRHPEWLARTRGGEPLPGMYNPPWGGGHDGFMWALDTTHPEVEAHLEQTAAALVGAGYGYLKLDFTFAPSYDGVWHDPGATPAQRVRRGYEAVRRGARDDTFILGCGVPLSNVVGVVDGNRIGPDVAPSWERDRGREGLAGYESALPSTRQALHATFARSFMHRRLWLNDPDCLMLRTEQTDLTTDQAGSWAWAIALSGGMVLVSDDLALLDGEARRRLEQVISRGRASDAAAIDGSTPRCRDLLRHRDVRVLDRKVPTFDVTLDVDTATGGCTIDVHR
jgi:alpha-galactosidase